MITTLLAQGVELGGEIKGPGGYAAGADGSGATDKFASFASNIFSFLTVVAGIMFLLYFMLGALNWVMAGGDEGKVEKARNQISNAAIGLVVVALAYSIAFIVGGVVGIDILNPGEVIKNLTPGASSSVTPGTAPIPNNATVYQGH